MTGYNNTPDMPYTGVDVRLVIAAGVLILILAALTMLAARRAQ